MKTLIFLGLAGFSTFYLLVWRLAIRDGLKVAMPTPLQLGIGAITNFFDTLGIGSFATTTALFRMKKLVSDRLIPGTLNVGHTPATIAQAFIYIAIVEVDTTTLVAMIAAACLGAWLGAGVVSGWPIQKVRIGMGIALLVAASLFLMTQLGLMPKGGDTLGLSGAKLAIAVIGNFGLGALMSLGIGLYGPCMILIYMLGMVPTAAFPIMMGSCAFLMPTSTARFLKAKSLDPQAALGLALGGVPAVLIAAFIVKSMPLDYVRWLVIVVVTYTAITMLRTAFLEKDKPAA
jgi:uncharacterized membrane protein YfcA